LKIFKFIAGLLFRAVDLEQAHGNNADDAANQKPDKE
jgi:hypothetical protein